MIASAAAPPEQADEALHEARQIERLAAAISTLASGQARLALMVRSEHEAKARQHSGLVRADLLAEAHEIAEIELRALEIERQMTQLQERERAECPITKRRQERAAAAQAGGQ